MAGAGFLAWADLEPSELFWTAHTSGKDTWQTEYRFEAAETYGASNDEAA